MDPRKQQEIQHYDSRAERWKANPSKTKWNTDVHVIAHDLFLSYNFCNEWLKKHSKNKKLLDLGCGTGIHSILPAREGAQVIGIDLSQKSLDIAKERATREGLQNQIQFIQMDGESLTFPDKTFDLIFDGGTFSSIDIQKTIPELARVLKPTGYLLGIETLGHNPLANLKRRLNVARGTRTSWAAEHIFLQKDFTQLQRYFGHIEKHYFHLLSLFALPFSKLPGGTFLFKTLDSLDSYLLRIPFLQKYAFKTVFICSEPHDVPI